MGLRLGNFVARHWLGVLFAWLLLAVALRAAAPRWDEVARDGDLAFLPAEMPSIRAETLLEKAFPQARASSQIVLVFARRDEVLRSDDYKFADQVAEVFRAHLDRGTLPLRDVWTVNTEVIGAILQSRDRSAILISLQLNTEFMAVENIGVLNQARSELLTAAADQPAGLEVGITGSAAIGGDMLDAARESITNTEQMTIFLVVVTLLLVYRAPLLVTVPLITIFVSIQVALPLVAMFTKLGVLPGMEWWRFQVFKTTKIFVVVILYGAGTDYCLFLIARFKEELSNGREASAAVAAALGQVGGALVASGLTTILGLGMMIFADFGKYANSGPAIALCLTVALAACLTLAPALLAAFGTRVFWPLRAAALVSPRAPQRTDSRPGSWDDDWSLWLAAWAAFPARLTTAFWTTLAGLILRWPGSMLVLALLVMAPAAYEGLSVDVTYDLLSELGDRRVSVHGARLMRKHFPPGETGPVSVLVYRERGGFDRPEGERELSLLTKLLFDMPDDEGARIAARVRSVTEPLGDVPGYVQMFSLSGLRKLAIKPHSLSKQRYVSQVPPYVGRVARLDVILRYDPFSAEAIELVNVLDRQLRQLAADKQGPWSGAEFLLAGVTPGIRDLRAVTESDQRRIQILVVLAVLLVLLLILRQPIVCVYLILSVLWSYFVTMGLTEATFQWLYGATYLGLDWKVPLFLFVILIAVGEDYNIYLVTRVNEEQRKLGPRPGLTQGLISTGGIITSCGVIMAGTFVSMMAGSLRGMIELGFALSLGVILDTFVVRTMLVPAFLALLIRERRGETNSAPRSETSPETAPGG